MGRDFWRITHSRGVQKRVGPKRYAVRGSREVYDGDGLLARRFDDNSEHRKENVYLWGETSLGVPDGKRIMFDGGGFLPIFLDGGRQVVVEIPEEPKR